jgi:hypothetical protein
VLQLTWLCRCLCCNLTYILLGISQRLKLLDIMAILFLCFLQKFHSIFHSCTNLHSQQQCMRVPLSPYHCQHLLLFVLLIVGILIGVRWNLNVVLICISFMARDSEHFFMLFSHLDLPLRKFCSVLLLISSLGYWILPSVVFLPPCVFWLLNPCQTYSWQTFFPIIWAESSI